MKPLGAVLLVDDEPNVLEGLKAALSEEPYKILIANCADEALKILSCEVIDVIVSDEKMPGMSGSEFLGIVCRDYPYTVRIVLTGQPSLEAAVRSINEGQVYRFLQKPCKAKELAIVIAEAFQLKSISEGSAQLMQIAEKQINILKNLTTHEKAKILSHGNMLIGSNTTHKNHSNIHEISPRHTFDNTNNHALSSLSSREQEIVILLVDGRRIHEVAKLLFISEHTVRNHLKSIYSKLDVHSQTELICKFREQ